MHSSVIGVFSRIFFVCGEGYLSQSLWVYANSQNHFPEQSTVVYKIKRDNIYVKNYRHLEKQFLLFSELVQI